MHICYHHIKVYYNIEKRKFVKIEIEIYRGTEMDQYQNSNTINVLTWSITLSHYRYIVATKTTARKYSQRTLR